MKKIFSIIALFVCFVSCGNRNKSPEEIYATDKLLEILELENPKGFRTTSFEEIGVINVRDECQERINALSGIPVDSSKVFLTPDWDLYYKAYRVKPLLSEGLIRYFYTFLDTVTDEENIVHMWKLSYSINKKPGVFYIMFNEGDGTPEERYGGFKMINDKSWGMSLCPNSWGFSQIIGTDGFLESFTEKEWGD